MSAVGRKVSSASSVGLPADSVAVMTMVLVEESPLTRDPFLCP